MNIKTHCRRNSNHYAPQRIINIEISRIMKLIKRFPTLQEWVKSIHKCKSYCTLKFYLYQVQWNECVFRFRRTQIVRYHIAQCVINGFSILLNSWIDLLLGYNWDLQWGNSDAGCKGYWTAKAEPHEELLDSFGCRAARPILFIGPWPTQKYFFEKISTGTLVLYKKKKFLNFFDSRVVDFILFIKF